MRDTLRLLAHRFESHGPSHGGTLHWRERPDEPSRLLHIMGDPRSLDALDRLDRQGRPSPPDNTAVLELHGERFGNNEMRVASARSLLWGPLVVPPNRGEVFAYPHADGGWSCWCCSLRDTGAADPMFPHAADLQGHLALHSLVEPASVSVATIEPIRLRAGQCGERGECSIDGRERRERRGVMCERPRGDCIESEESLARHQATVSAWGGPQVVEFFSERSRERLRRTFRTGTGGW